MKDLKIIYIGMKLNKKLCVFSVRGSTGINVGQGPPTYDAVSAFSKDDSKSCRTMFFSPEGRYFAWANGTCVQIVLCSTWKVIGKISRPKIQAIRFSPQGNYLMTWEPFIGKN